MSRRNIKNALGNSLAAETQAFEARLANADRVLEKSEPRAAGAGNIGSEADVAMGQSKGAFAPEVVTRVVREAFTMPEVEQAQIEKIRERLLKQASYATKSEVLRAGLLVLSELNDEELLEIIERIEKIRTGRPKHN